MGFIHDWRRFTDINYAIKTAPEQEIIYELRALREDLAAFRRSEIEAIREQTERIANDERLQFLLTTFHND